MSVYDDIQLVLILTGERAGELHTAALHIPVSNMTHGDEHIGPLRLERIYLPLRCLNLVLEHKACNSRGVGSCGGIHCCQAKKTYLDAAALYDHTAAVSALLLPGEKRFPFAVYIGGQYREVRQRHIGEKLLRTKIKLVVTGRHQVVSGKIHQRDDICSLCKRGNRQALCCVSRIHKNGVGRGSLQSGHLV